LFLLTLHSSRHNNNYYNITVTCILYQYNIHIICIIVGQAIATTIQKIIIAIAPKHEWGLFFEGVFWLYQLLLFFLSIVVVVVVVVFVFVFVFAAATVVVIPISGFQFCVQVCLYFCFKSSDIL